MTRKAHQNDQQAAVLYTRVSTLEQAREGISLAAQEAKLKAYCELRGLEVREVIRDAGVSGGKPMHTREGGQQVLELVARGAVGHVVAYKLDRLFRDCADCLTVTKAWAQRGVALHLVDLGGQTLDTSSAMGRFFLTIMAGAAELERALIAERVADTMSHKRACGEKTGGLLPYGYFLGEDGKTLLPNAHEQELVGTIRAGRQAGLSQRALLADLAHRGMTTRKGTPLGLRQLQLIMAREGIQ